MLGVGIPEIEKSVTSTIAVRWFALFPVATLVRKHSIAQLCGWRSKQQRQQQLSCTAQKLSFSLLS